MQINIKLRSLKCDLSTITVKINKMIRTSQNKLKCMLIKCRLVNYPTKKLCN